MGESRADWEILCDLGRRMGGKGFDFESPAEVMAEIAKVTPSYGGVSFERLEKDRSLQWPVPNADHPGTPFLHKGKFSRGLGKLHAIPFKAPAETPTAEYPLVLTTGRYSSQYHTGSMTRRSEKLEQEHPQAWCEMNPADAARAGLLDRSSVRVSSRRGQIEIDLRVTPTTQEGVVFIPFHYVEAAANLLTNAAVDPIAKIPEYKVCAVRVEASA